MALHPGFQLLEAVPDPGSVTARLTARHFNIGQLLKVAVAFLAHLLRLAIASLGNIVHRLRATDLQEVLAAPDAASDLTDRKKFAKIAKSAVQISLS